jgi:hypothetical protein
MKWCKHIKHTDVSRHDKISDSHYWSKHWTMYSDSRTHQIIEVPNTWKICPICETLRPTKENLASANLRFIMDNDQ